MKSDIQIAKEAKLIRAKDVGENLGMDREKIQSFGRHMAKVPLELMRKDHIEKSNLILVTAITPTKAGVGKTTVSIGLALGLNKIGKNAIVTLREPSLGPVFGMKGGAAVVDTRKYCPWKTSTYTLQAISMPSHRHTTPSRQCSTTT